jgi:flavin reductase (DIM6/NTAB) family NADH-FMN oxidoreductase RutF
MTVGWGSMGGMWGKPFVQVVVRPGRYTFQYMEKYPTFTLCAFPESCKKALTVLGTKSGRNSDKISESGLTVIESKVVEAPSYKEAKLILECRKMYWQDMDPKNFLTSAHRLQGRTIVGASFWRRVPVPICRVKSTSAPQG